MDCQGNWTYWIDNYDSQSDLSSGGPVLNFADHNLQMYVLGDSISDQGNLLAATSVIGPTYGVPPLPDPLHYFEGRFSATQILPVSSPAAKTIWFAPTDNPVR